MKVLMNRLFLSAMFSLCFCHSLFSDATPIQDVLQAGDYKKAIEFQKKKLTSDVNVDQGAVLKALAVLYLKDQDQEQAFETFLKSLDYAKRINCPKMTDAEESTYKAALAIYFDHKSGTNPKETAQVLIRQFAAELKRQPDNHQLAYLVALARANLNQYEEFFDLFYRAYGCYPDHFLAFKTKAILHIKLLERKKTEAERKVQREEVISNFEKALTIEPQDVTLYKLLITFASPETKQDQVRRCLNKIMGGNIIIPRSDVIFYVQEAVDAKENTLAQQFLDRAREWYQQSRIITAAQNYLDAHK